MEQEPTTDLLGRTSARLLALGVPREQRLDALHLLAILDATADGAGVVRRPLDDLAGEFELPAAAVLDALDHLEDAGAIERAGSVVHLVGREDGGIGGLRLAEFLEDVRVSSTTRHARVSRLQVRAAAAVLAAAAAAAVLTFAPSTSTPPMPVASGGSSTALAPVSTSEPSARVTTALAGERRGTGSSSVDDLADGSVLEPPVTTAIAAALCPDGGPLLDIVDGLVVATNTARADLVITAVTVAGANLVGLELVVPAGQTVVADELPALPGATIDAWDWVDQELERGCPS